MKHCLVYLLVLLLVAQYCAAQADGVDQSYFGGGKANSNKEGEGNDPRGYDSDGPMPDSIFGDENDKGGGSGGDQNEDTKGDKPDDHKGTTEAPIPDKFGLDQPQKELVNTPYGSGQSGSTLGAGGVIGVLVALLIVAVMGAIVFMRYTRSQKEIDTAAAVTASTIQLSVPAADLEDTNNDPAPSVVPQQQESAGEEGDGDEPIHDVEII